MKILSRLPRWMQITTLLSLGLFIVVGYVSYDRFLRAYPAQQFTDQDERFKYGSIGAEQDARHDQAVAGRR